MKSIKQAAYLLALSPTAGFAVGCNADNVLRALQRFSASASPFCSTYTLPPPDQPLPTYVSQYPASRVSSGCSCLITPTTTSTTQSTTLTTSTTTLSTTPSPGTSVCRGEVVRNGGFDETINNEPVAWVFAGETQQPNGQTTLATSTSRGNNVVASFFIQNGQTGLSGSTYIRQSLPALCPGRTYTLSYESQISINDGSPRQTCSVRIDLRDTSLVYIGPPNGDPPPFTYQTRTKEFTYTGSGGPNELKVVFSCDAPQGSYTLDNVSLVGA
ncbi:MAG: hypothetical protein Q9214_004699 [Letrouitia sp. 1 TL-2023]